MAELKEIFEMVTQKTEPKEDAWREQEERQRRETRSRRIRAYTAVAAVIIVALVAVAFLGEYGSSQTPATTPTPAAGSVTHFVVDIETRELTPFPIAMFGARLIAPSPDGTMFAYNGCCSGSLDPLVLVTADGTERTISSRGMSGYAPAWTPDGSTIVFQGRRADGFDLGALYAYDVATNERRKLIDFGGMKSGWWIVQSDVSPDGSTVLFNLPRGKPAREDLWTVPIDGGSRTLVRRDAAFAEYGADGIVFLDHPKDFAGRSMWMMDADGSNARELVSGASIGWPHVSPDGRRVAYASDRRIYVVGTAGGNPVEVATDSGLEVEPVWIDNSRLIVG